MKTSSGQTIQVNPDLERILIPGTDASILANYATLQNRAQEMQFATTEPEYLVLDTETTGFDASEDALIEIAAAIVQGPKILREFQTFVNPERPIPELIIELTNITQADVDGAPSSDEAIRQLVEFCGDRQIIAHNASFDQQFILANATQEIEDFPNLDLSKLPLVLKGTPWIDTVELARIALPRLREHNLESLSAAFAPNSQSTHRAIDDVVALCAIWRVLLVALSDFPPGLCGLLVKMFPDSGWNVREPIKLVADYLESGQSKATYFQLNEARAELMNTLKKQNKLDAEELDGGIIKLEPVSRDELAQAFSSKGLLGLMYPNYETRSEQLEMASEVAAAYNTSTHRAIEAGTGVGKSMAYLLPQTLFAQRNHISCGVATKTNTLLDQLIYHELPKLDAALRQRGSDGLQYVALKGYSHYPCLRKLMRAANGQKPKRGELLLVAQLLAYVCQSASGDIDPLPLRWGDVPRFEICASADDCLKNKCRYYRCCLLHSIRKQAGNADIVVTNHALLFCDVMTDGGILPPIRHWVIDEAHGAQAEARRQLAQELEARSLRAVLDALLGSTGALNLLRTAAAKGGDGTLIVGLVDRVLSDGQAVSTLTDSFFSYVKELCELAEQSSYDRVELWINGGVRNSGPWGAVQSSGSALVLRLNKMLSACKDLISACNQVPELQEVQNRLVGLVSEISQNCEALICILDGEDDSYVYYAELDRRENVLADKLVCATIDVGQVLLENFYPSEASVVFTSATIALGAGYNTSNPAFDFFLKGVGLDRLPKTKIATLQLDSSYDFDKNMTVLIPEDMPLPNTSGYHLGLEELLYQVHMAMGGSVLTLFTNRREMEGLHSKLKTRLEAQNITLRCQHRGISKKRLHDEFIEDEKLSLFALRSFWEGFDAGGNTLRCVVIPKLPFGRPNDPLQSERGTRERNAWKAYALPEAVIELKQAAGRLIRSSTDSGYLILADARLTQKSYGQDFLEALPSKNIQTMTIAKIAKYIS